MRGVLTMPLDAYGSHKSEFLSEAEKKRMIWALQQVLKNPEVESIYRLAKIMDLTYPSVFKWFRGETLVGPRYVKLLVKLSLGKATEKDFRPDIFYDIK